MPLKPVIMQLTPNKTFALQTDLALYCRTGKNEPETSIQEHTFHYRRLVYNIIKDTMKTAFPIARKLIGKKRWKKSVAYFFENHKCETPQVWRLPNEFCEFYEKNPFPFKKEFPFLKELLQYEWLEIEVFMMEDLPIENFNEEYSSKKDILVPNPEIKILPLQYPVHTKNVKQITEEDKGQYFVSVHRDYYTKQVKFNDLSFPLVEMLIKVNEDHTTIYDLKILFSKYEKDPQKADKIIDVFIDFALKNNLILGFNYN
jgi:hypothetical protein